MVQFLKTDEYGEVKAARRLAPDLPGRASGRRGFPVSATPAPRPSRPWPGELHSIPPRKFLAGEHDLVILDEVNLFLAYGLVPMDEMLEVLRQRPPHVEVVLTGRSAPPALVDLGGPGHRNAPGETLFRGRRQGRGA